MTTIADTIRAIWINRPRTGSDKSDWISLRNVRETIESYPDTNWTRDQIDRALLDLITSRSARVIPESNQKILTDNDRDAALVIAGKNYHLITFAQQ